MQSGWVMIKRVTVQQGHLQSWLCYLCNSLQPGACRSLLLCISTEPFIHKPLSMLFPLNWIWRVLEGGKKKSNFFWGVFTPPQKNCNTLNVWKWEKSISYRRWTKAAMPEVPTLNSGTVLVWRDEQREKFKSRILFLPSHTWWVTDCSCHGCQKVSFRESEKLSEAAPNNQHWWKLFIIVWFTGCSLSV